MKERRYVQGQERMKAMHHREKALKFPSRYMCLMIDGMDKKKTCLPHFSRSPKHNPDRCLVQMHLVGSLSYHIEVKPYVFLTYPNVDNGPKPYHNNNAHGITILYWSFSNGVVCAA